MDHVETLKDLRPFADVLIFRYCFDSERNALSLTYSNQPSINVTVLYDALNRPTNMVDSVGMTRFG